MTTSFTPLLAEAGLGLPIWAMALIKIGAALGVVLVGALLCVYLFLFKGLSFMQSRLGPMEAGPHGTLQAFAEAIKWMEKEDLVPDGADRTVFKMAPLLFICTAFLVFLVTPFGPDLQLANLDAGIFVVLALSSISTLAVLMAGWSSANKYSLTGAIRAAGQLIAYELPMVLSVVGVVIQAGSMNVQDIVKAQVNMEVFGLYLGGVPFMFPQVIGFVIFLISAQAELSQTPFDMPIAESELVSGYSTEYSGFRFLIWFLAEFGAVFGYGCLVAALFMGGWALPFGPQSGIVANVIGVVVTLAKALVISGLVFWVRFTMPRFREDQLQRLAWKVLIPLALVNIAVTAILKVVF